MDKPPMSGKRFLHVIGDSKFGGDAVYMFAIAEMARSEGATVEVCSTTPETLALAQKLGFTTLTWPKITREIDPWKDLTALLSMVRLCRQNLYDLVHTHTSKGGVIGRVGARLAGTPVVIHTVHGFAFHAGSSPLQRSFYQNVERIAGMFCDLAISVNDEDRIAAVTLNILPERKVLTIKNGVNPDRFNGPFDRSEYRRTLGVSSDELLIGTLSRFSQQKDPFTFIRAAELVLSKYDTAKFLYAGDGPMVDEVRTEIRRRGIESRFIMPGFVTDSEKCIRSLDIYVTTSLYEGLPVALIEAMCVGLPLVVTDVKGNRECVTTECALLVEKANEESVSDAISRFIESRRLREDLGAAARRRFEREFSQDRMVSETRDAYYSVLRSKT